MINLSVDLTCVERVVGIKGGQQSTPPNYSIIAFDETAFTDPSGDTRPVRIVVHEGPAKPVVRYARTRVFVIISPEEDEFRDLVAVLSTRDARELQATLFAANYHDAASSPADPNTFIDEDLLGFSFGARITP